MYYFLLLLGVDFDVGDLMFFLFVQEEPHFIPQHLNKSLKAIQIDSKATYNANNAHNM